MGEPPLFGAYFWYPSSVRGYAAFAWTPARMPGIRAASAGLKKEYANLIAYDHESQ